MKNKVILVTGWNCTGKSTFANRLAELIGVPFFNAFEKYDCECLTYMFNGDLDVLGERYFSRERHWVHSTARDAGVMRRYPEARKLMNVEVGQMVYIDATSFEKVDYEDLFAQAKKFIEYK